MKELLSENTLFQGKTTLKIYESKLNLFWVHFGTLVNVNKHILPI